MFPSSEVLTNTLIQCCNICGKNHNIQDCDFIKISEHVPDNLVPSRAKLTLPDFLEIKRLTDGTFTVCTKSFIKKGTQFGPFQAERSQTLEATVVFPLKVFSVDENENFEYLVNNNEEKCSWLMFVEPAADLEEQNLICYQENNELFYVAIKDIAIGDILKVWYSPYYALKMNQPLLLSKSHCDNNLENIDVNSLIKNQQKIMERTLWTCKFCSQIYNNIISFAKHILKHYSAQHKNMCEICKKTFGSKKNLRNHMKIVHKMFFTTPQPKPSKNIELASKVQCKDVALGGPLLNDMFTDSSDLQQSELNQFDLNIDNQNLLLDNDNLTVENLLNENVKDLDHFNFEIDDNQKQFVCDICLKQFTKVKLLIVHLRHHTGDFMCYKCLRIFCRKENLRSHICNINSQYRCTICEKKFTQKKYLSRHLLAVHNKKFHCVSCNRCYYSNKELLEHNCSKIPLADKEKFICSICNKHFYRNSYLRKHLKTHEPRTKTTNPIGTTCDVCGLQLENRNSYYLHKKKHENPSHVCDTCNKKFHRLDILKEHILTHDESHNFECDTCQKKFKSKKILMKHIKIHDCASLPRIKCSKCDGTFKDRAILNKHIKNCHPDNNCNVVMEYYKCPICNKTVKLKSSLVRHLRKVHDVTNIDLSSINLKRVININKTNSNKKTKELTLNSSNEIKLNEIITDSTEIELDNQINTILNNTQTKSAIDKQFDNLVEELDINGKKEQQSKEVCLSIPDLVDSYQEITLDKNAYILENGTIVQPQADSDNVVIYVLDQPYSQKHEYFN